MADISRWQRRLAALCSLRSGSCLPDSSSDVVARSAKDLKKERRNLTRCVIKGSSATPVTLSVPVAHGGKTQISDHGRWQRAHINALHTCYASTPFGPALLAELAPLYSLPLPSPMSLFFDKGEMIISEWLDLENSISHALSLRNKNPGLYQNLVKENSTDINNSLWIGDLIMQRGRSAIWSLLPPL